MTDRETEHRWLVGGLVGLGVLLLAIGLFAVGYAVGRDRASEPVTIGEQLEAWTSCMREAGANVPAVEARSDGGFTVTVEGSFLEDFDIGALVAAAAQCQHLEPGSLFGELLEGGMPFLSGRGSLPGRGGELRPFPGDPDERGATQLSEICERLRRTDALPENLPELLAAVCGFEEE